GMGGMGGGMGGMGGYGGPGTPMSKFTASRLLRYCVSLGKSDAWPGLPDDDRIAAATMARELALYIAYPAADNSHAKLPPELLEVIRSIPDVERTESETYILMDLDNTIRNPVEVPGSSVSVPPVSEPPAAIDADSSNSATPTGQPVTLFKGQDLNRWMQALEVERDVDSLAEAMTAVETLSRETDAETRTAAAQKTMTVARRLGGIVIGGDTNPSHQFMSHFTPTFSRYFPEPGVTVVRHEIENGNSNSRIASLWALHNYLYGLSTGMTSLVTNQTSTAWIEDLVNQEEGPEQLHQLCEQLLQFAGANATKESSSERTMDETKMGMQAASEMASASALWIKVAAGDEVSGDSRLTEYLTNHINTIRKNLKASGSAGSLNPQQHGLNETLLTAAIQIAAEDPMFGTPECWEFLAAMIAIPENPQQFGSWVLSDRYLTAFEQFKKSQPKILLAEIDRSLGSPTLLITRVQWYELVIPFYASEFESREKAAESLRLFEAALDAQGTPQESLREVVQEARATVRKRESEQRVSDVLEGKR
ncbi:MAG: hypothetical protein KDB00_16905, partial [Planctomycetales bacterium]|nr:hypothetical protein [Planctomycetales bacterium]